MYELLLFNSLLKRELFIEGYNKYAYSFWAAFKSYVFEKMLKVCNFSFVHSVYIVNIN